VSAAELRRALAAGYDRDEASGVFVARGAGPFAYSDGAAAEAYVAEAVRAAGDLRDGSPELAARIRDWPSQYHLSPARANLLRPLADRVRGRVLEVGAGCGAITRFLGESGATVLAVEGSRARAAIAAARCRDLDNVVVVCDNFENLGPPLRFDLVTLIGVLEYSRMFIAGDDPVQAMLVLARDRLADGGTLALAIENQLGLKYLAGAREDHLGVPYLGVTGQYGAKTPVTFGRRELRERLQRAGFGDAQLLYPFPDYKLPAAIVTDAGFAHPAFNAADLIATAYVHRFDDAGPAAYPESLARDVFIRNGLGPDIANSFLVAAGGGAGERGTLAYAYSVGRDRAYSGETRFEAQEGGVKVVRRPLFPAQASESGAIAHARVESEPYVEGEVLHRGLQRLAARPGWTVEDLFAWAAPWVELLEELAAVGNATRSAGRELPAHLFDCTPFNVVRRRDGSLAAFDLEWHAPDAASSTLGRIVFRGLYNALLRLEFVAPPATGVATDIAALVESAMQRLGVGVPRDQLLAWIGDDYVLTGAIAGIPRPGGMPELPALRIAGEAAAPPHRPAPSSDSERLRLAARERELDSILARPHHRLASWFGGLIEPFPRLRAMLRARLDALGGRRPLRIGAIVHLYYADLWPELRDYLRRIPSLAKLYVSIPDDAPVDTEARIAGDLPGAQVRRFPNRGRDVLPFLEWIGVADRQGMELVCKVHGKRSPHLATGDAWRRDMLDKLLGSEAAVRAIIESFRADATLGIVGPGGHVMPSSYYWERNAVRVEALCDRLGFDVKGAEFSYVTGSMFWARPQAFTPLRLLGLRAGDFEPEPAPVDGTLAHALERCFPIAARIAGMRVGETDNPRGTGVRDFAP
jgi:precorrin-6B methylase 2